MENELNDSLKMMLGAGGSLSLLVLAVKWLISERDKVSGALVNSQNARMELLEKQSIQCSNDRVELHRNMNALQNEVRTLYKSIVAGKFDRSFFSEDVLNQNEPRAEASISS